MKLGDVKQKPFFCERDRELEAQVLQSPPIKQTFMIKWADDDPRNSIYYHDLNNCGQELEPSDPIKHPVFNKQGKKVKDYWLMSAYCVVHQIIVCECGWERYMHFGSLNRTLPPLLGNSKRESDENLNTRTQIGSPGTG